MCAHALVFSSQPKFMYLGSVSHGSRTRSFTNPRGMRAILRTFFRLWDPDGLQNALSRSLPYRPCPTHHISGRHCVSNPSIDVLLISLWAATSERFRDPSSALAVVALSQAAALSHSVQLVYTRPRNHLASIDGRLLLTPRSGRLPGLFFRCFRLQLQGVDTAGSVELFLQ